MDGFWLQLVEAIGNLSMKSNLVGLPFRGSPAMTWHQEHLAVSSSKPVLKSSSMRYAVVIERVTSNFSAYVPDLPGCVATGGSLEEVDVLIREAISFHIEGMRADGTPIPAPTSHVEYVDIAA